MSVNSPATGSKKGPGCFFYGCLTAIILVILLIIVSYFAVRSFVHGITDDKPLTFSEVQTTEQDFQRVNSKITEFGDLLQKSPGVHSIDLTAEEINTLIAYHPKLNQLRDMVRVHIEGEKIGGSISLDLGSTLGLFSGRYVNGTAVFSVKMVKGEPDIRIESFEFNGSAVDRSVLSELQKENLVDEVKKDRDTKQLASRIRSIAVQNGVLHLEVEGEDSSASAPQEVPIAAPPADHAHDLQRAETAAGSSGE